MNKQWTVLVSPRLHLTVLISTDNQYMIVPVLADYGKQDVVGYRLIELVDTSFEVQVFETLEAAKSFVKTLDD